MSLLSASIRRQGPLAKKVAQAAAEREARFNREQAERIAREAEEAERLRQERIEAQVTALREWIETNKNSPASIRDAIDRFARAHGYTFQDLLMPRREPDLVRVRHLAMVMAAQRFPMVPINRIASVFNRDHSVIIYAMKKHNAWPRTGAAE